MIRARSDFMFVVLLYFTLDNVCNKMNVFKERTDLFICLVANLNVYVWKKTVIFTKCALRRLENGNLLSSCWCIAATAAIPFDSSKCSANCKQMPGFL